jgi:hypothetical protein
VILASPVDKRPLFNEPSAIMVNDDSRDDSKREPSKNLSANDMLESLRMPNKKYQEDNTLNFDSSEEDEEDKKE